MLWSQCQKEDCSPTRGHLKTIEIWPEPPTSKPTHPPHRLLIAALTIQNKRALKQPAWLPATANDCRQELIFHKAFQERKFTKRGVVSSGLGSFI